MLYDLPVYEKTGCVGKQMSETSEIPLKQSTSALHPPFRATKAIRNVSSNVPNNSPNHFLCHAGFTFTRSAGTPKGQKDILYEQTGGH